MRLSPRSVLASAVAAAALLAGSAGPAAAIANGDEVAEGQYRFSVKLTMTGIPKPDGTKRNSACSGALISSQWIVTAGHCFRDANGVRVERPVADLTTATVGRAKLDGTNGEVRTVVAVRQLFDMDLSVAKLDQPVAGIRPVRLATETPTVSTILRLTGYGADRSTNPVPSTVLRTGQFTVTSVAVKTIGVTAYAPKPDTSACPYDSGAPYFVEEYGRAVLVGIENFGPPCPHDKEETVARIDVAANWIRTAIR